MLLFIRHPAREIVTALLAFILSPLDDVIVESNSFAPAPTIIPVVVKTLHLRIVPVNVPRYGCELNVHSVSIPVAEVPTLEPKPDPVEHLKNVPEALVNPVIVEQSVNTPDAVPPNEPLPVDTHRVNVPLAVPMPNELPPAVQSSNNPEAIAVNVPEPANVPPNEESPAAHLRYVPEYSVAVRIPESVVPLNTQFSIYVRLNRSVAVPMLPESLTVER
jgi:hypothetical protein